MMRCCTREEISDSRYNELEGDVLHKRENKSLENTSSDLRSVGHFHAHLTRRHAPIDRALGVGQS